MAGSRGRGSWASYRRPPLAEEVCVVRRFSSICIYIISIVSPSISPDGKDSEIPRTDTTDSSPTLATRKTSSLGAVSLTTCLCLSLPNKNIYEYDIPPHSHLGLKPSPLTRATGSVPRQELEFLLRTPHDIGPIATARPEGGETNYISLASHLGAQLGRIRAEQARAV